MSNNLNPQEKESAAPGVTLFTVELDAIGWKAVMRRDEKIIKETYALDQDDAQIIRDYYVNEFWGFQLN